MAIKNPAQLLVIETGEPLAAYSLDDVQTSIGRAGSGNEVSLKSPQVSSKHGVISYHNGKYVYNDLNSTNGTYYNNSKLAAQQGNRISAPIALKDGDVLTIGQTGKILLVFCADSNLEWKFINCVKEPKITVGRGTENTITVTNVSVSRLHAVISNNQGKIVITDLKSKNGTFLNGNAVKGTIEFRNQDIVRIGNSRMIRIGNAIIYGVPSVAKASSSAAKTIDKSGINTGTYIYAKPQKTVEPEIRRKRNVSGGGVEVVVNDISRIVSCKQGTGINGSNKKSILDHVSLTIRPGELVAILGGSGAGKTTFMNCINGFEPATQGTVLINGTDLYRNYSTIKSTIGYVPQQDIVHDNLTLEAMLTYTGKLRLPSDMTKQELSERVAEVLDMVDLTKEKDTYIKKLSGGQRKRASIAVELVSDPTLFFLDEPTSGLDPEAETNLMHQLRRLSDEKGKTVIVITHTLQNIHLFDKVIFLAPGGKLCFYGTPEDAKKFFAVDNLADAYEKISADIDGYVRKYNAYAGNGNVRRYAV